MTKVGIAKIGVSAVKNLFFLLAILLCAGEVRSQDIITTKDGVDIRARVVGLTDTEVEYRKFDEINGPVYTILMSELIQIRYEDGTKEVFSKDSEDAFKALGSNPAFEGPPSQLLPKQTPPKKVNPKVDETARAKKYAKYKRMKRSGVVLTILGSVALVAGSAAISTMTATSDDTYTQHTLFGAFSIASGTVGVCVGIPLWIAGGASQRKYRPLPKEVSVYLGPSRQSSGLALSLRF